jgi:hypothetical protein
VRDEVFSCWGGLVSNVASDGFVPSRTRLRGKRAPAASVEEIALLKSAERQRILVEGAKKEGKLSFYTTLIDRSGDPANERRPSKKSTHSFRWSISAVIRIA